MSTRAARRPPRRCRQRRPQEPRHRFGSRLATSTRMTFVAEVPESTKCPSRVKCKWPDRSDVRTHWRRHHGISCARRWSAGSSIGHDGRARHSQFRPRCSKRKYHNRPTLLTLLTSRLIVSTRGVPETSETFRRCPEAKLSVMYTASICPLHNIASR